VRSIKTKLALLVVSAVALSVLLVSVSAAWNDASRRYAAKRDELKGIAATIATAVAHPLSRGDAENVTRTLSAVGRIPGITYARVSDASGKPVQQFGFGVVVARERGPVTPNVDISPTDLIYLSTYPVVVPIVSGGVSIGQLTLIADLSNLRGALVESLLSALAMGLLAGAAGLVLSLKLQRAIAQPVSSLKDAMIEVSKSRNFSTVVPKVSNDEIGDLVDAFNGMLLEVRSRDQALLEHRDRLEDEVSLRTEAYLDAKLAAEAASAAKSEFLATMSHEIRTPMNGMLVMAELIASGELPPRLQRYADVMLGSGQTLLAITNDILDFSKVEAGKIELESVPVDVRKLIDETLQLFSVRAMSKGLELASDVRTSVPKSIAADPVRLKQIVSNLLNNAIKFTESGNVIVRVEETSGQDQATALLAIQVSDTGVGIPEAKLASIFDAFSQADQSTTRQFGGTGIGLTISRRLADAMGGSITVESVVGSGSTFTVRIPFPVLAEATSVSGLQDPSDVNVLIDLPTSATRDILAQALRVRGLNPIFSVDALEDETLRLRAIVATVEDMQSVAETYSSRRDGAARPTLIAVSKFGASRTAQTGAEEIIDLTLSLPLASVDLDDCLATLCARRASSRRERARGRTDVAASSQSRMPSGIRVLAADDSAVNREVLTEALDRLGVSVVCVENGQAALEAVMRTRFDVVLMDCSMPVKDGFTATREIRDWEKRHGSPPAPIVALTAYVVGEAADAWRSAGMTDYLTKPYTLATLRQCLERSLGLASAATETRPIQTASETKVPAPSSSDDSFIDDEVLQSIREMQGPGENLVERIVQLYVDHAPAGLDRLSEMIRAENVSGTAAAAHALRSLSRNIGATRVGDLCAVIEADVAQDGLAAIRQHWQDVVAAMPQTIEALQAMYGRPTSADADVTLPSAMRASG
jgi:signal transduction histidine kinase/CheY-like chemotaxis protein/HPt (histidine-containing phosphotransfer) domain-containing protein